MTDTHSSLLIARSHLGTPILTFEISSDERWLLAGTVDSMCVVDLSENQLRIVRHITERIIGPITALHYRSTQRSPLLFASQDRICTIFALSKLDPSAATYRRLVDLDQGPTSSITKITVYQRSSHILTAHQNGCLAVWDGNTPCAIQYVVRAHDAAITALQWIDDERLVSASIDGCVKFWRFPDGRETA